MYWKDCWARTGKNLIPLKIQLSKNWIPVFTIQKKFKEYFCFMEVCTNVFRSFTKVRWTSVKFQKVEDICTWRLSRQGFSKKMYVVFKYIQKSNTTPGLLFWATRTLSCHLLKWCLTKKFCWRKIRSMVLGTFIQV